ncbi:MAG: protein-glutamate methylesterase/protein-glutamine glutaminase [Planctomycetota bacterium]
MTTRVLVVDDSSLVRKLLTRQLEQDPEIEVVGAAPDPYVARDMIVEHEPDVVTLDIEMPRMDGVTFLRKLMKHHPMPVIIVSSLTSKGGKLSMRALEAGAVEVVQKAGNQYTPGDMGDSLTRKVKAAAGVNVRSLKKTRSGQVSRTESLTRDFKTSHNLLVIGASTGGTVALQKILENLPASTPPTLVVQHMPQSFTRYFADRLDTLSDMDVREAEDRDQLVGGLALICPGNYHMTVKRSGAKYRVRVNKGPLVNRHRPSVDVLFKSAAVAGKNAVGVILTGMGRDGARGMKAMHEAGAHTIAQDENTSVVYGMPRAAVQLDAVDEELPIERIPDAIVRALK